MDAGKLMLNAAICFSGLRALASLFNPWSLFGQQLYAALALFRSSFHQHTIAGAQPNKPWHAGNAAAAAACGQRIRGAKPRKTWTGPTQKLKKVQSKFTGIPAR